MARPKQPRPLTATGSRSEQDRHVDRPHDPESALLSTANPPRRNLPLLIASTVLYAACLAFLLYMAAGPQR